jgi:acetyl esterase/lipase
MKVMLKQTLTALSIVTCLVTTAFSDDRAKPTTSSKPHPTEVNVPYGKHAKQVVDFYKAESQEPTPVVIYIHGGAWWAGNKNNPTVGEYLKAGISVVSVEYRFINDATKVGIKPPVKALLHDAGRAVQFVRSKAKQWNIDKTRIGATGGSAGACSSLWLAFHNDLADPKSDDPISRESTRLYCAAVLNAQTSLDPKQMKEWTPNSSYGGHAFGFNPKGNLSRFDVFLAARNDVLPSIKEYSPYEHVTIDDPPIGLYYRTPPAMGQNQKDPTHTANFGMGLQEKCKSVGVECHLVYPGASDVEYSNVSEFLITNLKRPK